MTDITWTTEQRKLSDLAEWEHNPAEITDHDAQQLKRSIDKFGLALPLIANVNGGLIDGHQRKMVMLMLDGHLPSELVDVRIPSRELSEDERTELAVRLRRNVGQWNWDTLANEFEIDDLKDWGFTDVDFELAGWDTEEEPLPDSGAQIDKAAELQEKWGTALGQVWELGDHRLVCGDCTDAAVVESVMRGEMAKVYATDPPYGANAGNIGFTAQRDDIEAITKDDLEDVEMQAFLESAFGAWIPHLERDCAWYLWHPMLTQGYFAAAAAAADLIIHRQIIWVKEQFIFGRGDYHWRHELCFYGWRKGNRPQWFGERNQDTVWTVPWGEKRSAIGHPTAKPPELFARPMLNHTKRGDICAEPFCGSGSQIVAGEQLGRKVLAAEVEPKYVAVALQRWHDMTNREPVLVAE